MYNVYYTLVDSLRYHPPKETLGMRHTAWTYGWEENLWRPSTQIIPKDVDQARYRCFPLVILVKLLPVPHNSQVPARSMLPVTYRRLGTP